MQAEKKVVAETYRERETPLYVVIPLILAGVGFLAFMVILWFEKYFTLGSWAHLWFCLVFGSLFGVGCIAAIVFLLAGWRWSFWQLHRHFPHGFPCAVVPPRHTIKVQFLHLLSEQHYLPSDMTQWNSRSVKVTINDDDCRALIRFDGGLLKDKKTLEDDLRSRGYMRTMKDPSVEDLSLSDGNSGLVINLDYMEPDVRAKKNAALDRGRW